MMGSVGRLGLTFFGGAITGGIVTKFVNKKEKIDVTYIEPRNPSLKHGAPRALMPVATPICYSNHCLEFDPQRRTPKWVAEHINREKVKPKQPQANRKHSKFRSDPALPAEFRSTNDDFWNSGWSRGHMAPAGNNKFDQKAMDETFFLSNVVPQNFDNNGDFWNRLEIFCRDLTDRYPDVWVISGPLWLAKEPEKQEEQDESGDAKKRKKRQNKIVHYEVIGKNEVSVPTHLYKAVLVEKKDSNGKPKPLVAAFVVPNEPIPRKAQLVDFKIPLPSLERHLGVSFFPRLDRAHLGDFCQEDEGRCQMMDYKRFQSYYISRGIKGARNENELNKYWKRAQSLDLVTPEITTIYDDKKVEIAKKNKDKAESMAKPA